jgi:hypothetical protein
MPCAATGLDNASPTDKPAYNADFANLNCDRIPITPQPAESDPSFRKKPLLAVLLFRDNVAGAHKVKRRNGGFRV